MRGTTRVQGLQEGTNGKRRGGLMRIIAETKPALRLLNGGIVRRWVAGLNTFLMREGIPLGLWRFRTETRRAWVVAVAGCLLSGAVCGRAKDYRFALAHAW